MPGRVSPKRKCREKKWLRKGNRSCPEANGQSLLQSGGKRRREMKKKEWMWGGKRAKKYGMEEETARFLIFEVAVPGGGRDGVFGKVNQKKKIGVELNTEVGVKRKNSRVTGFGGDGNRGGKNPASRAEIAWEKISVQTNGFEPRETATIGVRRWRERGGIHGMACAVTREPGQGKKEPDRKGEDCRDARTSMYWCARFGGDRGNKRILRT